MRVVPILSWLALPVLFYLQGCGHRHHDAVAPTPLPHYDGPGVVISHHPAPSKMDLLMRRAVYTASPSILVLESGRYLVSYNVFGPGARADESGRTYVYRSEDKGKHWELIQTMDEMKRGSLFQQEGTVYLLGYRNDNRRGGGDILIRKSDDDGETWTEPRDAHTGLLVEGDFGGTPHNPAIHEGRIWATMAMRVFSAPVEADLLAADSWTLSTSGDTRGGPLGEGLIITEAQIMASPEEGVVMMPKIGGLPHTVLLRAHSPEKIEKPTSEDWVALPGGEKKFGAAYDPVSQGFFVLSNPVRAEDREKEKPELIRNQAAVLFSRNLRDWSVVHVFLLSPHVEYEAFQYLNFDFDGDDMVVVSRTAYDVGGPKPPRGHDSNLVTFHRINQFRQYVD